MSDLTIDSTINLSDNEIKTNTSNANLKFSANGTGSVEIAKADINGGAIDDTPIGGTTPSLGTFTTATTGTQAVIDGITIKTSGWSCIAFSHYVHQAPLIQQFVGEEAIWSQRG